MPDCPLRQTPSKLEAAAPKRSQRDVSGWAAAVQKWVIFPRARRKVFLCATRDLPLRAISAMSNRNTNMPSPNVVRQRGRAPRSTPRCSQSGHEGLWPPRRCGSGHNIGRDVGEGQSRGVTRAIVARPIRDHPRLAARDAAIFLSAESVLYRHRGASWEQAERCPRSPRIVPPGRLTNSKPDSTWRRDARAPSYGPTLSDVFRVPLVLTHS